MKTMKILGFRGTRLGTESTQTRPIFYSLFVPFLRSAYCLTLTSCLQSLERENICFETEIRKMLNAMNLQKDQNDQICDEVARLEKSLTHSQVIYFTFFLYLKVKTNCILCFTLF